MHAAARVTICLLVAGLIAGFGTLFYARGYQANLGWARADAAQCTVLSYNITLTAASCGGDDSGCFRGDIRVAYAGYRSAIAVWYGSYADNGRAWLGAAYPVASNVSCFYLACRPLDVRLSPPPLRAYLGAAVGFFGLALAIVVGFAAREARRWCRRRRK